MFKGLAAGKGVVLPSTLKEALESLKSIMIDSRFGEAGKEIVIEEKLEGPETSILAFTDGFVFVFESASRQWVFVRNVTISRR